MWNLEGSKVTGLYLGEFQVSGTVSMTSLNAGTVLHFVDLDEGIRLPWSDELRTEVVLNENQISRVHG